MPAATAAASAAIDGSGAGLSGTPVHGSAKTVAELTEIAEGIGRPVRERTTTYGVPPERSAAAPGLELV